MPNETKNDFCCLIVSGFGASSQAGVILRDHMCDSGIDTFLTTPSGNEDLRLDKDHWVHGVRMEYLSLRKRYQRVALVGLSLGGVLLLHMQDLGPAASIFVNTPCVSERQTRLWNRIFQSDLQPRMSGVCALPARYQLKLLIQQTKKRGAGCVQCPVLVLQTQDDAVCDSSNAEHLFKQLHVPDKSLRYYPAGGHDVLCSRTVLAVCSDIFQFCSRIRGLEVDPIKQEEQLLEEESF